VDYFDHDADIGIVGRGPTLEAAFVDGARAMASLMTDTAAVAPREALRFAFEEEDVELAFVRWLNLLLAHAAERGLALGEFALAREGERWSGEARGEPWRAGLERGVDVKGATLTALAVRRLADGTWEARCVGDV
jgi:SHS2 domain-containing protein